MANPQNDPLFMFNDPDWRKNTSIFEQYAVFQNKVKSDPDWKRLTKEQKSSVLRQNFGFDNPYDLLQHPDYKALDPQIQERAFNAVVDEDERWHLMPTRKRQEIRAQYLGTINPAAYAPQGFAASEEKRVSEQPGAPGMRPEPLQPGVSADPESGQLSVEFTPPPQTRDERGRIVVQPLERPPDYRDRKVRAAVAQSGDLYAPELHGGLAPEVVEEIVNAPKTTRPYLERAYGPQPQISAREEMAAARDAALAGQETLPTGYVNLGDDKNPMLLSPGRVQKGQELGVIELTEEEGKALSKRGVKTRHVELPAMQVPGGGEVGGGVVMLRNPVELSKEELEKARELDGVRPMLAQNEDIRGFMKFNPGAGIDDVIKWANENGVQLLDAERIKKEMGVDMPPEMLLKAIANGKKTDDAMSRITSNLLDPEFYSQNRANQTAFLMENLPIADEKTRREAAKKILDEYAGPIKKDFDSLPERIRPQFSEDPTERDTELRKHPYWNSLKAGIGDLVQSIGGAMFLAGREEAPAYAERGRGFGAGPTSEELSYEPEETPGKRLIEKGQEISEKYTDTGVEQDLVQNILRSSPSTVSLMVPGAVASIASGGAVVPIVISALGAGAVEAFMEGGSTAAESLLAGDQEAVARSKGIRVVRDNLAYQTGTSVLENLAAFAPSARLLGSVPSFIKNMRMTQKMADGWNTLGRLGVVRAIDTATRLASTGELEYAEEWLQTAFQQAAEHGGSTIEQIFDYTDEQLKERQEAGRVGRWMGVGMATAGTGVRGLANYFSEEGEAGRVKQKFIDDEVKRLAKILKAKPSEVRRDIAAAARAAGEGATSEQAMEVDALAKDLKIDRDEVEADIEGARAAAWGTHDDSEVKQLALQFGVPEYYVRQNWDEVNAAAGRGAMPEDKRTAPPGAASTGTMDDSTKEAWDRVPNDHKAVIQSRADELTQQRIQEKMLEYGLSEEEADQFPENERADIEARSLNDVFNAYRATDMGRKALGVEPPAKKPAKKLPVAAEGEAAAPPAQKPASQQGAAQAPTKPVGEWRTEINAATTLDELADIEARWKQDPQRGKSKKVQKTLDSRRKKLTTEAAAELDLADLEYQGEGTTAKLSDLEDGSQVRYTTPDGVRLEGRVRVDPDNPGQVAIDDGNQLNYVSVDEEVEVVSRIRKASPPKPAKVPKAPKVEAKKYDGLTIHEWAESYELETGEAPGAVELHEYMTGKMTSTDSIRGTTTAMGGNVKISEDGVRSALENDKFNGYSPLEWIQKYTEHYGEGPTAGKLAKFINESASLKGAKAVSRAKAKSLMDIADYTPVKGDEDADVDTEETDTIDEESFDAESEAIEGAESEQTEEVIAGVKMEEQSNGMPKISVIKRAIDSATTKGELDRLEQIEREGGTDGTVKPRKSVLSKIESKRQELAEKKEEPKKPAPKKQAPKRVSVDGVGTNASGTPSLKDMKAKLKSATTFAEVDEIEAIENQAVKDGLLEKPRTSLESALVAAKKRIKEAQATEESIIEEEVVAEEAAAEPEPVPVPKKPAGKPTKKKASKAKPTRVIPEPVETVQEPEAPAKPKPPSQKVKPKKQKAKAPPDPATVVDEPQVESEKRETEDSVLTKPTQEIKRDKKGAAMINDLKKAVDAATTREELAYILSIHAADIRDGRKRKLSAPLARRIEERLLEIEVKEAVGDVEGAVDIFESADAGEVVYVPGEYDPQTRTMTSGGYVRVPKSRMPKKEAKKKEPTEEELMQQLQKTMDAEWPWPASREEEQGEAYEYLNTLKGKKLIGEIADEIAQRWLLTNGIDDMIDSDFVNQVLNEMQAQADSVTPDIRESVVATLENAELMDYNRIVRVFLFHEYPEATTLKEATGDPASKELGGRNPRDVFQRYLQLARIEQEDALRGVNPEDLNAKMRKSAGTALVDKKKIEPSKDELDRAAAMGDEDLGIAVVLSEDSETQELDATWVEALKREKAKRLKEDPNRTIPSKKTEVVDILAKREGRQKTEEELFEEELEAMEAALEAALKEGMPVEPEETSSKRRDLVGGARRGLDEAAYPDVTNVGKAGPVGFEQIHRIFNRQDGWVVDEQDTGYILTHESGLRLFIGFTDNALMYKSSNKKAIERAVAKYGKLGGLAVKARVAMTSVLRSATGAKQFTEEITGLHLIIMNKHFSGEQALGHEAFHFALRNFLSDEEIRRIDDAFLTEEHAAFFFDLAWHNALIAEEQLADIEARKGMKRGTIMQIFDKIRDISKKVLAAIGIGDPSFVDGKGIISMSKIIDHTIKQRNKEAGFKGEGRLDLSEDQKMFLSELTGKFVSGQVWSAPRKAFLPKSGRVRRMTSPSSGAVVRSGRVLTGPMEARRAEDAISATHAMRMALMTYTREYILKNGTKDGDVYAVPATPFLQEAITAGDIALKGPDAPVRYVTFMFSPTGMPEVLGMDYSSSSAAQAARRGNEFGDFLSAEDFGAGDGPALSSARGGDPESANRSDVRTEEEIRKAIELHLPENIQNDPSPMKQDAGTRERGQEKLNQYPKLAERISKYKFRGIKSWIRTNLKPARGLDKDLYLAFIQRRRGAQRGRWLGQAADQRIKMIIQDLKGKYGEDRVSNALSMVLDGRMPLSQFTRIFDLKGRDANLSSLQKILDDLQETRAALASNPNIPQKLRDLILSNKFYQTRMYAIHVLGDGYIAPQDAYQAAIDAVYDMHTDEINKILLKASEVVGTRDVFDLKTYMESGVVQRQRMLAGLSKTKAGAIERLATALDPWMRVIDDLQVTSGNVTAVWAQESLSAVAAETVEAYLGSASDQGRGAPGPIGGIPITHQMHRNLDEVFRKLYGEITSPAERLARTIEVQQDLLSSSMFFQKIFEEGEGKWWSGSKRGQFSKRLSSERTGKLTPMDRRRYGNMAGKYVTQETYDLMHAEGTFANIADANAFLRFFNHLQGITRSTRLIWPKTIIRNAATSVTGFAFRCGDALRPGWKGHFADGVKLSHRIGRAILAENGWLVDGKVAKRDPEALEILADLVSKDVFDMSHDSILTAINANIDISKQSDNKSMSFLRQAMMAYSLIDLPAKYASYKSSLDMGWSEKESVEHIRKFYQYRDFVPGAVGKINRMFMGDYFGYTFDSTRIWGNATKYAVTEAAKGNVRPLFGYIFSLTIPVYRIGTGVSMAAAAPKLFTSIAKATAQPFGNILAAIMGTEDDDDEWRIATPEETNALRKSLPGYDRFMPLAVWYEKKDGKWNLNWHVIGNTSAFPIEDWFIGAFQASANNPDVTFGEALLHNLSEASPFTMGMAVQNAIKLATGRDMSTGYQDAGMVDVFLSMKAADDDTAVRPDAPKIMADRISEYVGETFAPGQTFNVISAALEVMQGREPRLGNYIKRKDWEDVSDVFIRLVRKYEATPEDQLRLLSKMTQTNMQNLSVAKRMSSTADRQGLKWEDGANRYEVLQSDMGRNAWQRSLKNIEKRVQDFKVLTRGNFSDEEIMEQLLASGTIRKSEARHIVDGTVDDMTIEDFKTDPTGAPALKGESRIIKYFESGSPQSITYGEMYDQMKAAGYDVGTRQGFITKARKMRSEWFKRKSEE